MGTSACESRPATVLTFDAFDGGVGRISASGMPGALIGCLGTVEPSCQTLAGTCLSCCRYLDAGYGDCALTARKR